MTDGSDGDGRGSRDADSACPGVAIRPAAGDEAERIVDELWLPLAREMAALDPSNALADDARSAAVAHRRELLESADTAIWVAETEGEEETVDRGPAWAGYVCARVAAPPPVFARGASVHVEELYVRPASRGGGVGAALLERAHDWGRERGCERATLSVNVANETARKFYERLGYEVQSHRMARRL